MRKSLQLSIGLLTILTFSAIVFAGPTRPHTGLSENAWDFEKRRCPDRCFLLLPLKRHGRCPATARCRTAKADKNHAGIRISIEGSFHEGPRSVL